MKDLSEKLRELHELQELSKLAAWKDRILPLITQRRDAHITAGMSKNSTAEKRSEHVEAYHLAVDIIAHVPERITTLTREIAAQQKAENQSAELPSALSDRT